MTTPLSASQATAGHLVSLLPRLLKGFSKREENLLSKGKISVPQMLTLDYLAHLKQAKMGELSRFLSIKMGSATGLVDRLIKTGLVARSSDPDDRRVVWIRITPRGKRAITSILSERQKTMSEVFSKIPRDDQEQFIRTFEKVCEILNRDET